jgi:hypothetical protein
MSGRLTIVGAAVVFVLFGAFVLLILYLQYRARRQRVRDLAALAGRIGFTFTRDDVDRVVDMPFKLFTAGDGRKVELVMSGTHNSLPMRLFDYWYYDEQSDGRGSRSRSYHRFTCALVTLPVASPPLRLTHEDLLTRIESHLGMHDVEFEYDDFNRRFRVKCNDQKFAFALFDGQMMQWLLGADTFDTVEVVGPWVLLAAKRRQPAHWLELGGWLDQFHAHVPPVVYSSYPPT